MKLYLVSLLVTNDDKNTYGHRAVNVQAVSEDEAVGYAVCRFLVDGYALLDVSVVEQEFLVLKECN